MNLTNEQYLALVALARRGTPTADEQRALDTFLRDIERSNGAVRYLLVVQWQEVDQPLPPTTRFPESWPPSLRFVLERQDRPIAKADVLAMLKVKARQAENVMVTRDPGGIVGWTKIDEFFIT